MKTFKLKIEQLELKNRELLDKLAVDKSCYSQIQELLGGDYEGEEEHFLLNSGIVFYLPKCKLDGSNTKECLAVLNEMVDRVWSDREAKEGNVETVKNSIKTTATITK